jgi:hypothetical protein
VGLGHALHRWLSGLMLSKQDARFSGRQEHLRDLGTQAQQGLDPRLWPVVSPLLLRAQTRPHRVTRPVGG